MCSSCTCFWPRHLLIQSFHPSTHLLIHSIRSFVRVQADHHGRQLHQRLRGRSAEEDSHAGVCVCLCARVRVSGLLIICYVEDLLKKIRTQVGGCVCVRARACVSVCVADLLSFLLSSLHINKSCLYFSSSITGRSTSRICCWEETLPLTCIHSC